MVNAKFLWAAASCLLFNAAQAHPGPHPAPDASLLATRSTKAKRCANEVGMMKRKRHLQRKRDLPAKRDTTDYTIHAQAPHYDFLKNDTCLLFPESTQGPYYFPRSEILRQDMREGQPGIETELDISLIDVNTCEPLEGALISLWHCNATGSYSSFAGNDPNIGFGEAVKGKTGEDFSVNSTLQGRAISRYAALFLSTDNSTWLRGMWPTDANGASFFTTIFPGFYIGRTIHIHIQVHTNWSITKNGTVEHSRVVETGQIFFDEQTSAELMAVEPYSQHFEIDRVQNDVDGIYAEQALAGVMNYADVEPLDGADMKNGVLAYIALGIDTTTIKNGTTADFNGIDIPEGN